MLGDSSTSTRPATLPRVLLADDHRMVADAIAQFLAPGFELVDVVSDGEALVRRAAELRPDVVLSDITMPRLSGIEAMRQIQARRLGCAFVFMTVHKEPAMVREAIELGARGYVLKAAAGEELVRALRDVVEGRVYVSQELWSSAIGASSVPMLTPRQKTVLQLLATGLRSRDIATQLGTTPRTVDTHRYAILKAFGVRTSIALVREAQRLGLISRDRDGDK